MVEPVKLGSDYKIISSSEREVTAAAPDRHVVYEGAHSTGNVVSWNVKVPDKERYISGLATGRVPLHGPKNAKFGESKSLTRFSAPSDEDVITPVPVSDRGAILITYDYGDEHGKYFPQGIQQLGLELGDRKEHVAREVGVLSRAETAGLLDSHQVGGSLIALGDAYAEKAKNMKAAQAIAPDKVTDKQIAFASEASELLTKVGKSFFNRHEAKLVEERLAPIVEKYGNLQSHAMV